MNKRSARGKGSGLSASSRWQLGGSAHKRPERGGPRRNAHSCERSFRRHLGYHRRRPALAHPVPHTACFFHCVRHRKIRRDIAQTPSMQKTLQTPSRPTPSTTVFPLRAMLVQLTWLSPPPTTATARPPARASPAKLPAAAWSKSPPTCASAWMSAVRLLPELVCEICGADAASIGGARAWPQRTWQPEAGVFETRACSYAPSAKSCLGGAHS
mmetsp:Transcript_58009/g.168282  ORF Transcript_58009/g.168282 Transcript_58009/m.168282 type:complete len:213 (-) Transcript_58009:510-1148(-)